MDDLGNAVPAPTAEEKLAWETELAKVEEEIRTLRQVSGERGTEARERERRRPRRDRDRGEREAEARERPRRERSIFVDPYERPP